MIRIFVTAILLSSFAAGDCLPIGEARKKIGTTACITGKVVKVAQSAKSGTHFLNFCEDYKSCPFSVVIFNRNLPDVGDVRWLEGKTIEIHGMVKDYNGQAEIILSDVRQLQGEAAKLPLLPRHYDVETKGKYSAGQINPPTATKPAKPKKSKKGDNADLGQDNPPPPQ